MIFTVCPLGLFTGETIVISVERLAPKAEMHFRRLWQAFTSGAPAWVSTCVKSTLEVLNP